MLMAGPIDSLEVLKTFKPLTRGDGDQETRGDGVAAPVLRRWQTLATCILLCMLPFFVKS